MLASYPQNAGEESDAFLLRSTRGWTDDAMSLRQMLSDYMGPDSSKVTLLATENNCVSSLPDKQSTSLVNAVYLADSFGQLLTTEFEALFWWDLRNGQESNPNPAGLYGWRNYGDYGPLCVA
jgi:alpha-L-arabinofuranosidase